MDATTAQRIESAAGGIGVPDELRRSAEDASGLDLGGVRIHQGSESAALSSSLQATAFTVGSDIFLGADAARPGSTAGDRLLAHELGHVVDERSASAGRVRRLATGAGLRADFGGPSKFSTTYRNLIDVLDEYEAKLNKPLNSGWDNAAMLKDVRYCESLIKRIQTSCDKFLGGHEKGKRAARVAQIKAHTGYEQAAWSKIVAELERGPKPTWLTWKEAIAPLTPRDLSSEGAVAGEAKKSTMNTATKFTFPTRPDAYFKPDKARVEMSAGSEMAHTEGLAIPRGEQGWTEFGPDFENWEEHDRSGPRFARRAAASSRIDKLLNANVLVATQLAVRNTRDGIVEGQIMERAKGKELAYFKSDVEEGNAPGASIDDPELQRLLSKLDLVDSLCGQVDRHGGNVFVDRDDATGRVTAVSGIDLDMSFGTKNFTPGERKQEHNVYAGVGRYIDEETGEALLKLRAEDLHGVLDDLLLPDEVDAAIGRLLATQAIVQAAKDDGRLIGPDRWAADTVREGRMRGGFQDPTGYHAALLHPT